MTPLMILLLAMVASTAAEKPMLCGIVSLHAEDPNVANVTGVLTVIQSKPGASVSITGTIYGLTKGPHGFHVHEKGDLRKGCISTGPHFNPTEKEHGGPTSRDSHVGDLGNIEADDNGVATIRITDNIISLTGSNSILGRAIVVHALEDDLGEGHEETSATTGNSGARVACGIIGALKI